MEGRKIGVSHGEPKLKIERNSFRKYAQIIEGGLCRQETDPSILMQEITKTQARIKRMSSS